MLYKDDSDAFSDRKRWYALLTSILTVATPDEAIRLINSNDKKVLDETFKRIKNMQIIERREKNPHINHIECKAPQCVSKAHTNGYCQKHHLRLINHNSLDKPIKISTSGKKCSIENCNEKHLANGLCRHHYDSVSRGYKCKAVGCEYYQFKKGLCGIHYHQIHMKNEAQKEGVTV